MPGSVASGTNCITRLASNETFSPSNKLHREVGRAKDLSAPRHSLIWSQYAIYTIWLSRYKSTVNVIFIGRATCLKVCSSLGKTRAVRESKAPWTLSIKLGDFTVWRHAWQENWVNRRSFDRQQRRHQNLPFKSSFTQRTAQFTQGIPQFPSKQQTTALFLSTIVTRTRRHTELTKKTDKPDGKLEMCHRICSSVFRAVFLIQLNCTV